MFCVGNVWWNCTKKNSIRSRKSMLGISALIFCWTCKLSAELKIQVNCTTNIACEWMLDYGGCEQLERFLASAVRWFFYSWKNVFFCPSKMEWHGSCGLNSNVVFLGVTCFSSPLLNGCWTLSIWLVTHMLRGAEFASADTFPGVIKNGFNGFLICL